MEVISPYRCCVIRHRCFTGTTDYDMNHVLHLGPINSTSGLLEREEGGGGQTLTKDSRLTFQGEATTMDVRA